MVELITSGRSGDLGLAVARPNGNGAGRHKGGITPAETIGQNAGGAQGVRNAEITEGVRRLMSSTITPVDSAAPPPAASGGASEPASVGSFLGDYVRRVRGGEVGSLPAILAIIVLSIIFQSQSSKFLSLYNFANLFTQGAAVTVIAMGLVFVLLIGEIDLSAGYTAGVCGVTVSLLITQVPGFPLPHGQSVWLAISVGLIAGALIGALIGFLVTRLGIPSFVVTLAAT